MSDYKELDTAEDSCTQAVRAMDELHNSLEKLGRHEEASQVLAWLLQIRPLNARLTQELKEKWES